MVHTTTALSVLTIALLSTTAVANQPRHASRAPHKKVAAAVADSARSLIPDFDKIRRAGNDVMAKASGSDEKKKRKVRKRKNVCAPQAPFNVSAPSASATYATGTSSVWPTSPASSTASSASILNNQDMVSGSATKTASHSSSASASATAASYNSAWTLEETWSGSSFFDHFSFWNYADPTHGTVNYVDSGTAWNTGLVSTNSAGNAVIKVDTTPKVSGNRNSVRLHGNLVFTGGLVLLDIVHMPTGCGTWPAWWQNGPNWPIGGEIDILEGVNNFAYNQVSLHTDNGCTMQSGAQSMSGALTSGSFDNLNCASYATNNQGCGVRAKDTTSYGAGLNAIGGGVYAMRWDKYGINVYWFPRTSIPADITAEQPMPKTWGTPIADFPSTSCDPYKYFYDHFNIFDTTLCGDWAGGVWNYADAGETQSCAAKTGYSTCAAYVQNEGAKFSKAYWEVSSVKYYNSTTEL